MVTYDADGTCTVINDEASCEYASTEATCEGEEFWRSWCVRGAWSPRRLRVQQRRIRYHDLGLAEMTRLPRCRRGRLLLRFQR